MRCDVGNQLLTQIGRSLRPGICATLVLAIGLGAPTADGQVFDSGSDGSDGALNFSCPSPPCEVIFDPVALGLDLDGDNVFQFTTVTIPAGLTLKLTVGKLHWAPVYWLATGAVQIDGTIDLSGQPGHPPFLRARSDPGPGGFQGGSAFGDSENPATAGFGPGAGLVAPCTFNNGQGAGYGTPGRDCAAAVLDNTYGNIFLLPLIGGSGGSGGGNVNARGGGAGGGALLIASSVFITVDGGIIADGGEATTVTPQAHTDNGGGGSGGAIRLLAPVINGSGSLSTAGGPAASIWGKGGDGRIRLEAFEQNFAGTTTSVLRVMVLSPNALILPQDVPSVRVVTVNGMAVPDYPTGNFLSPDLTINESSFVTLTIEARNIPLGTKEDPTVVTLLVFPEGQPDLAVETTQLEGRLELSTASASVTFPHGFSRFTVRALWTP